MKHFLPVFLIIVLLSFQCKTKKPVSQTNHYLIGKVLDKNNLPLENVEVISKTHSLYTITDQDGNFIIKNQSFVSEYNNSENIQLLLRKESFLTREITINKLTHAAGNFKISSFRLEKIKPTESKQENKSEQKPNEQKTVIKKPAKESSNYTDVNIGKIENSGNGEIHVGSKEINNDNRTIINETKIIRETKTIEIPFEERDCAQKNIGYLKVINTYNEGINIKLVTYGEKKSPMAKSFEYYTISKQNEKLLRLTSNYYYGINGERYSEKWAGTYTFGFSDGFFINPCDTVLITTP